MKKLFEPILKWLKAHYIGLVGILLLSLVVTIIVFFVVVQFAPQILPGNGDGRHKKFTDSNNMQTMLIF
jgi:hypothetical protein